MTREEKVKLKEELDSYVKKLYHIKDVYIEPTIENINTTFDKLNDDKDVEIERFGSDIEFWFETMNDLWWYGKW